MCSSDLFSTESRKFIIGDAPGHEQYTRNMVTAASSADAAVVLVDAIKLDWRNPQLELLAQTRRHALLVNLLRKFPCGYNNEGVQVTVIGLDHPVDNRKQISCRLAGTRLGTGNHIPALKNNRYRSFLYRGRLGKPHRIKAFLEFAVKVEVLKNQVLRQLVSESNIKPTKIKTGRRMSPPVRNPDTTKDERQPNEMAYENRFIIE